MTTHPMPDPAALNKAIAEEVRVLLTRRKVTQKALQDALGWSRAKVNRLVNAEQTWGPAELLAVCDYLDVDLAVLLSTAKAAAKDGGAPESTLTDVERAFVAEIQAARTAQGLTQAQLAKQARLAEATVKRIEAGETRATSEQLFKICTALGLTVLELATRAEARIAAGSRRRPTRKAANG